MASYNSKNLTVTLHHSLDLDKPIRPFSPSGQSTKKRPLTSDTETMSEQEPLLNSRQGNGYEDKSEMRIVSESFFEQTIRPCLGEFIGVALFVFVGTMSVSGAGGILGVAVAHGLMIALLVAALGNVR